MKQNNVDIYNSWRQDWNKYIREVLKVSLDKEQQKIVESVQLNKMVSVCSGTARGKDYVTAAIVLCFMYLTPEFDKSGELIKNTKVALTAPTDRQIKNIMYPEVKRMWKRAQVLPGTCTGYDIRTPYEEWFLTGFKADEHNHEAWSGFHAANTMFAITEASGIAETIYEAIEGNLQGNSRLLLVFNPNSNMGYAASSQKSKRFVKHKLNSLDSPNVIQKKEVIPGQVDYEWIVDKVDKWCTQIQEYEVNKGNNDFEFEGKFYRPDDVFRRKVLGEFPKVSSDTLIPMSWIELANENWKNSQPSIYEQSLFGADVAGMGNDESVISERRDNYVYPFETYTGNGEADHMAFTGVIVNKIKEGNYCFIDTIGEGAGVYSRLDEQGYETAISCKFSESAEGLRDINDVLEFENMRAYLYWALRDWLNPINKNNPCLPPDDVFMEEATIITYKFKSNGKVLIESKDDIKKKLGRSPDRIDALVNTFYPYHFNTDLEDTARRKLGSIFG